MSFFSCVMLSPSRSTPHPPHIFLLCVPRTQHLWQGVKGRHQQCFLCSLWQTGSRVNTGFPSCSARKLGFLKCSVAHTFRLLGLRSCLLEPSPPDAPRPQSEGRHTWHHAVSEIIHHSLASAHMHSFSVGHGTLQGLPLRQVEPWWHYSGAMETGNGPGLGCYVSWHICILTSTAAEAGVVGTPTKTRVQHMLSPTQVANYPGAGRDCWSTESCGPPVSAWAQRLPQLATGQEQWSWQLLLQRVSVAVQRESNAAVLRFIGRSMDL